MAVDSRNKRFSLIGLGSPVPSFTPNPDGDLTTTYDRPMLLSLYYGLIEIEVPESSTETLDNRKERVAKYALHIYDTNGDKQAIITDFYALSYIRNVNGPGALTFALDGNHAIISSIQDKWPVEVKRRQIDGTWVTELWTLFRDEQWKYPKSGSVFFAYCQGIESILGWRVINWPSGISNRTAFSSQPAETIMKTLVDYNAGSNATTANGRKRDGAISGVTVESDSGGGNSVDLYVHGANLLEVLVELALVGDGDFDFNATSPIDYQFRFHSGQLGDDLSTDLTFSLERGNMANPVWEVQRSTEKTVATVWGQGKGESRDYATQTGPNYSSNNDIEFYIDARNVAKGNTAGLQDKGDAKLEASKAIESFTFDVLQTSGSRYGDDYDLGDLVSAKNPFNGDISTLQIKSVKVQLESDGSERIAIEVDTP